MYTVDKYTEISGLMPRSEWTKLLEINKTLLSACKEASKELKEAFEEYATKIY